MATNHTTNYQLNQWEATDQVLRTDFNQDNAKLDAALHGLEERTGALESAAAGFGNCQLWTTSYIGNGVVGYNSVNCITFPKLPQAVVIQSADGECALFLWGATDYRILAGTAGEGEITWSGTTLSWACTSNGLNLERPQLNRENVTYFVLAFLPADE